MPNVLIRCDASVNAGFGHVVRCLALAQALRELGVPLITFAMTKDCAGNAMAINANFPIETFETSHPNSKVERLWLEKLILKLNISVLILDIRTELSLEDTSYLRSKLIKLVCIDDISERRLAADEVFAPAVPQFKNLDWNGFRGRKYIGWDWILMPACFSKIKKKIITSGYHRSKLRLLVTMGGSDPYRLTDRVLWFLDTLVGEYEIHLILGSGFVDINRLIKRTNRFTHTVYIHKNPKNLPELMMRSDLALASFGATAYELTAMGVPAIYFALSEDHAQSCGALVSQGAAICLGVFDQVEDQSVRQTIENLMADQFLRKQMHKACLQLIDGAGAKRVAHIILNGAGSDSTQ